MGIRWKEDMVQRVKAFSMGRSKLFYRTIPSLVGPLTILASSSYLYGILWDLDFQDLSVEERLFPLQKAKKEALFSEIQEQITHFFEGKRKKFSLPLMKEGTLFQKRVWDQLEKIEYGTTISYKELAQRVGDSKKARAVGNANGKNPIPIVIPCHRVIAEDGSLGGFGGGLDKKVLLLDLEKRFRNSAFLQKKVFPFRLKQEV